MHDTFCSFFFFLMIRRPPRSTLFLHDALPISVTLPGGATTVSMTRLTIAPVAGRSITLVVPSTNTGNPGLRVGDGDRKSTRLNSSHGYISYAVFCLKKKNLERYSYMTLYRVE